MTNILKRGALLKVKLGKRLKSPPLSLEIEEPLMNIVLHNRLHFDYFIVIQWRLDERRFDGWCVMRHEMLLKIWFSVGDSRSNELIFSFLSQGSTKPWNFQVESFFQKWKKIHRKYIYFNEKSFANYLIEIKLFYFLKKLILITNYKPSKYSSTLWTRKFLFRRKGFAWNCLRFTLIVTFLLRIFLIHLISWLVPPLVRRQIRWAVEHFVALRAAIFDVNDSTAPMLG